MYKACNSYWDNARDEDKESLSSSFWTDQESEEEEREYFVKDDSRDGRDEKEPGINIHENKETLVKEVNMNDWTVGKLRENENCSKADKQCSIKEYTRDESTEKHLCEKLRNDTTEISSDKESDEDKEERECFVKNDSTDESSKSISGSGESTEEESEDYVKESSDNKTESSESDQECFTGEKEKREPDHKEVIDRQKVMSDEQQSISCAENEYVGSEYLSSEEEENEEESDKNDHEKDEGTEKMSGSDDCSVNEESEGEHGDHFVNNDIIDRRVDEETTNVDLESEEEIEYFVSDAKHNFTICEDEGSQFFVNQDGVDRLVLKEDCISEEPEIKSSRQRIDRQEEEGHFLNTNYHYSVVEQKSLEEKECEEKQDKNKITTFMAENPTSVVQNKTCSNRYYTAETERTDQMNNKQDETKEGYTVPELKRENSFDQEKRAKRNEEIHGETVAFNDNCGSVCSPTLSILTSGYGTYRPDSPKDDLDVADFRDDGTLTGLEEDTEYTSAIYGEEDNIQSVFQHTVPLEASEEQIHSLSLRGSDACESVAVLHNIDDKQDTTDENRYGSPNVRKENDQILHLASTFGGFPAKPTISGITSQGLSEGNHSSHSWEPDMVLEGYRHPFNLRLSKHMTVVGHRNEYGLLGQETRNTKKAKSQSSKRVEPVSELEERLDQLRVSAPHRQHELYSETDETGSYSDRHSSATEQLPSAFQAYVKGMTRSHSESDIRPRPKSFIRPVMDHPHTRNLKKTDPVAKYFQYKQNWEMFKPPGEKSRKELHWAIREQLMYQPPPPKPQRTYVPNTYVVPTEKKRSALRWEIRHDLANGIIPTKITYP